ncbi:radical SAM protein [Janthinobacterium sp. BJB401]|uniref:radical SAM protein n=1 Tax=Janthinobacterium sp. BJB401 TaxID=2745934 RepID=UPI0015954BC4|nr:radical SAM protein [Janthinobacterium sp. BJB401]NVI84315.1 radical SAM protein [Janthinobacterium sp. BJB401]
MINKEFYNLLDPNHLQLILLPTENCNFRCTYCYEDFEVGRMKDDTIKAIKILIRKRLSKIHSLSLSWFGGEPLIAKDIVKDITAYAQQAAAEAGAVFYADITTNAYTLNKFTFESLAELGIRSYQISLDGDKIEHDKTRKLTSGNGSFSKIWSNLISIKSSKLQFQIVLRIHLHKDNVESVKLLLDKIYHEFYSDERFSIFFKAVGDWGGDRVKEMNLMMSSAEVIAGLNTYLTQLGWYLPRTSEVIESTVRACYAALPNSFVIRADGSLAKCTVAFNDERNGVGKINSDGTLTIENKAMQSFMRGFQSMNPLDLLCPIKEMPKKVQVIQFYKIPTVLE